MVLFRPTAKYGQNSAEAPRQGGGEGRGTRLAQDGVQTLGVVEGGVLYPTPLPRFLSYCKKGRVRRGVRDPLSSPSERGLQIPPLHPSPSRRQGIEKAERRDPVSPPPQERSAGVGCRRSRSPTSRRGRRRRERSSPSTRCAGAASTPRSATIVCTPPGNCPVNFICISLFFYLMIFLGIHIFPLIVYVLLGFF